MKFHNNSYLNWKQYNTNSNTVLDEVFVYKQTDIDDTFAYDDILVGVSIGILIIFVCKTKNPGKKYVVSMINQRFWHYAPEA